jgi:polyphosphate kinase 2 (PPK2 family)
MKQLTKQFRVRPGDTVDLKRRPTRVDPVYSSKGEYKQLLDEHVARLSAQQELLYASNRHAVLIIFQAMDAAGKDGCIKHVMSGVNPQGCDVFSYSHPSPVIFNRSYYEEVLIVRVHPEILQAEALPDDGDDENIWQNRYRSIVGLERHLHGNGTRIVKIFLHVSKEEQRRRLLDRIDTQEKNWKIKPSDIAERKFWNRYCKAYEDCLSATSIREAPWNVVPADDKLTARLFVSQIILETLEGLEMTFPETTSDHRKELQAMRKQLESE